MFLILSNSLLFLLYIFKVFLLLRHGGYHYSTLLTIFFFFFFIKKYKQNQDILSTARGICFYFKCGLCKPKCWTSLLQTKQLYLGDIERVEILSETFYHYVLTFILIVLLFILFFILFNDYDFNVQNLFFEIDPFKLHSLLFIKCQSMNKKVRVPS